jgi:hypothetical protein
MDATADPVWAIVRPAPARAFQAAQLSSREYELGRAVVDRATGDIAVELYVHLCMVQKHWREGFSSLGISRRGGRPELLR